MASVARLKAMLAEIPDDYRAMGTTGGNLSVSAEDGSQWAILILTRRDDEVRVRWYNRKKQA